MIRTALIGLVVFISLCVAYVLSYLGAFKNVTLTLEGPVQFSLVGKNHMGPYHKIPPLIAEVETWAKNQGIECNQTFGLYLDNPDQFEEDDRLRSFGGCVLKSSIENIKLPAGYELKTLESPKLVHAFFQGSAAIGPQKVYPKAQDFMNQNQIVSKGPVLEIYTIKSERAMDTDYYFF